jgi:hypothetical protein
MNRKSVLAAIVFILFTALAAGAQTHLSVDIHDPVYRLIELGELKGAVSRLSAVRPYPRSQVVRILQEMWENRSLFSAGERQTLQQTMERFDLPRTGLRHGNIGYSRDERSVQVGVDFKADARMNFHQPEEGYLDSLTRAYLRGDLFPWLSYFGSMGFTFDRVGYDAFEPYEGLRYPAFVPYGFTKEWDAFHIFFGEDRYSDGTLDYPTISYDLGMDLTACFLEGDLVLRAARLRREWGIAEGSLTLGGTARPFIGAEVQVRLAPWLALSHVSGWLSSWAEEARSGKEPWPELTELTPEEREEFENSLTYQKLFTLQRLELFPLPWLYLSVSSSMVGARRFEPGYLSPLIFSLIYQNVLAENLDNMGLGIDAAFTLAPYGRLYFSFFADEMEITGFRELFTRPRNMFAFQAGLKVPVPRLPLTEFVFQYTKIEPFTYAHFPTWYADHYLGVDTSYTQDGENLAYPLPPNSDEFLVKLASLPLPRLAAGLEYRLIRHGDNPNKDPGDPAILGRIDGYYTPAANQADKDFLHDGLYDFSHIVTLSGEYRLARAPVTLGASYSFVYTLWEPNDSGEPDRPNETRNILALSVKVFR